jgi:hypothetical protein
MIEDLDFHKRFMQEWKSESFQMILSELPQWTDLNPNLPENIFIKRSQITSWTSASISGTMGTQKSRSYPNQRII